MNEDSTRSVAILQRALAAEEPIAALMDLAAGFLDAGDMESLRDVDVMLNDRFIHYVRNDGTEQLRTVAYALMAFVDTSSGDKLGSLPEGERLIHRWEHLADLCDFAIQNYDSRRAIRFVASRKHGEQLMRILEKQGSIRFKDLALQLKLSPPYLAKLLKELEKEELVVREREKNLSLVRLGFMGRVYVSEMEPESSCLPEPATPRFPESGSRQPYGTDPHATDPHEEDPYGEGDLGDEMGERIDGIARTGRPRLLLFPMDRSGRGELTNKTSKSERSKRRKKVA